MSQQTATSDNQQRAKIHTELGSLYLNDGRFGVALEEARMAMAIDSSYAPGYGLMGLIHMSLAENSIADEFFQKALSLAPGDPEINANYGWFLCQTDRERQSVSYFMNAIKNPLYTAPAKSLTSLGLCYLRMKDDKLAEDFFLKALRAEGNNRESLFRLGEIYYRKGRLDEARANLVALHRLMEPNAQTAWLALRVERRMGERENEARYAALLRRKFQGSPEYQKLMQGQFE